MFIPKTIIGLENTGNLCYLNSVLQLLFTVDPLNKHLLEMKDISFNSYNNVLIHAYKNLLDNIYTGVNIIDNDNMLESNQFKDILNKVFPYPLLNGQHDVHEILIGILNSFHDGLKSTMRGLNPLYKNLMCDDKIKRIAVNKWDEYHRNEKYSIINKLFKGQLRTKITCNVCFTENNIFDSFTDLSLSLNGDTLDDCIINFCKPELLEDEYQCERVQEVIEVEGR